MEFTKSKCNEISQISIDALTQALEQFGVSIERAGGSYEPQQFTMKIRLSCANDNGETQAQTDYKTYAKLFDLPIDMLGSTFNYNGKFFTVTGLLPNRRKNDIQIENAKGKTYVAPHESVVRAYNRHMDKKVGVKV